VYRSAILLLEGESYRFRQSLQRQTGAPGRATQPARRAEKGEAHDGRAEAHGETADAGPRNGNLQVSVTDADEGRVWFNATAGPRIAA
jgi:hypothetical protein